MGSAQDSATISKSCCRICLAAEKTLLSLQTEIELDGCKLTCLEMFTKFTGLEVCIVISLFLHIGLCF